MKAGTTESETRERSRIISIGASQREGERLLKEEEAAGVLSCSVAFLRRCRLFQNGPAYIKVGRLVRYSVTDLQAYMVANRVAA